MFAMCTARPPALIFITVVFASLGTTQATVAASNIMQYKINFYQPSHSLMFSPHYARGQGEGGWVRGQ
jgi:hypothetical protein